MAEEALRTLVQRLADRHPDDPAAFEPDGESVTFGQLQERVERARSALPAGVRRVGVRVSNDLDGVAGVHATWQHGATAVLLGGVLPAAEMRRRASEVACDVLLDPRSAEADPVDSRSGSATGAGSAGRAGRAGRAGSAGSAGSATERHDAPRVAGEAAILFTSGTTGRPKAAVLTFDALESSLASIAEGAGLDASGRPPTSPPRSPTPVFVSLAHVGGLIAPLNSMRQGKPFVLFDKFRVGEVFDIVERFRLRLLRLTPAMVHDLASWPEPRSLASVRSVTVGSAALGEGLRDRFEERYGALVLQSYGQTEFTGAIAFERYEDARAGRRPPGSVGRVAPGVEVEIVGTDGEVLPPGEVGEIRARSASAFSAYIQDGELVDPKDDGWHATGDLGRLDEEGFLSVVGRSDDTIVCGGFNVYPAMIEGGLARVEGVTDSVVTGLPDERLGEIPVAVVDVEADSGLDAEEIRARLRDHLAPYEIPRRIVVDAVPRTEGGKPDRERARALVEAARPAVPTRKE